MDATPVRAPSPRAAVVKTPAANKNTRHDKFTRELRDMIKARFPIIQIVTFEEERVLNEIEKVARQLNHKLMIWSTSRGIYHVPIQDESKAEKPNKFAQADLAVALEFLELTAEKQKSPVLMVLLDPDPYLTEKNANPVYRRKLRDIANNIRSKGYMANCLIVSPTVNIPLELEKDITVLDFPLPDREEIRDLIRPVRGNRVARRMLHERVGDDDEVAREPAAQEQRHRRAEMLARPEPLLAEHQQREETGFEDEREDAFHRERLTDHAAGLGGERRPVRAELKLHGNAGHDAHGEGQTEDADPETRGVVPRDVARAQADAFEHHDEQREAHRQLRKDVVKGEREAELDAMPEDRIGHGGQPPS